MTTVALLDTDEHQFDETVLAVASGIAVYCGDNPL